MPPPVRAAATHESHRIGEHHLADPVQLDLPHGRIQGREQLIGDVGRRAGQGIEQRRLAGVGVAHQRHGGHRHFAPHMPAGIALPRKFLQARFKVRMRLAISRRSVSSWVSPGPRKPMPPFWRSRWVQPRTRRVPGATAARVPPAACLRSCELAAQRCPESTRYGPILDDWSASRGFVPGSDSRFDPPAPLQHRRPPRPREFPRPYRIPRSTLGPAAHGSPIRCPRRPCRRMRPTPRIQQCRWDRRLAYADADQNRALATRRAFK